MNPFYLPLSILVVYCQTFFGFNTSANSNTHPKGYDSASLFVDSARMLNEAGKAAYRYGEYENAESLYLKSLSIKKKYLQKDDLRIGNTYLNLAILYRNIYNYNKAMQYLEETERIYLLHPDSIKHLGTLYLIKALLSYDINDYDAALLLYNKVIDMLPDTDPNLISAYNNLGELYFELANYPEAIKNFNKASNLSLNKIPIFHAKIQKMIAKTYTAIDDYENAGYYYQKSISELEKIYGNQHFEVAWAYLSLSDFYYTIGKKEAALTLINKSLKILTLRFGEYNKTLIPAYISLGKYLYNEKKYEQALEIFQKALIAISNNFKNTDWHKNPLPDDSYLLTEFIELLKFKAFTLHSYYLDTKKSDILSTCVQTFELSIRVIDNLRDQYLNEQSKLRINELEKDIYIQAVDAAYQNAENLNNSESFATVFWFSEKSKASVMLSSMRSSIALKSTNIPEELSTKEENFRKEVALLQELIYEEQKSTKPNDSLIRRWENKLIDLNHDYKDLIGFLDTKYPNYYNLKYNHNILNFPEVKLKMSNDEVMIEYMLCDSILYTYLISSNQLIVKKTAISPAFYSDLNTLIQEVQSGNFEAHWDASFNSFTSSSFNLYKTLITPVEKEIRGYNHLVIIPSGILSYIPFEVLIQSLPTDNKSDYKNLNYLIKSYTISYAYSATTLFEQFQKNTRAEKELLAIAPIYIATGDIQDNRSNMRQQYRQNLSPLKGIKEEVENILTLIDGDSLIDSMATESNFRRIAYQYDILHLAMHSYIDDENPMYSKLIFSAETNENFDGYLNTYELYNMNLHARMTVLSSCRTGGGVLKQGEGIISLARGFQYAGCPNVIMTLWEVEDKSGVALMTTFYKKIRSGYGRDEALRFAKLKFLEDADQLKSHPYFWANYIAIGDTSPLFKIYHHILFWIILVMSLILLGGVTIYIRKKRS